MYTLNDLEHLTRNLVLILLMLMFSVVCSMIGSAQCWPSSGPALVLCWPGTLAPPWLDMCDPVLAQRWPNILAICWFSIGPMLAQPWLNMFAQHWPSAGLTFWPSADQRRPALAQCWAWASVGSALGQRWANAGPTIAQHRSDFLSK